MEGKVIGSYRVARLLAVGGMGRVYVAVSAEGEEVALKLINADLARDAVYRRRFDREAGIAQRVHHPNVVPVLDKGEDEGIPYLIQKLIRGGTLSDLMRQDGRLEVPAALKLCAEVAGGLDALHAEGLVHRDVKPANILRDEQGVAYISDFGLAKDSKGSLLTTPGQAMGSMDYMAPEQIRGEDVTAETDVYALACVMYECLCGSPPFSDRAGMRVLWAHLQDEPRDPCAARYGIPEAVGSAIVSALAKDPAARPRTAGAFARLLAAGAAS